MRQEGRWEGRELEGVGEWAGMKGRRERSGRK